MAFDECVARVRAAAPNLTDDQAKVLIDEIDDILQKLQADKNVADIDAELNRAIEARIADEERAAINEKRMRVMNFRTRLKFIQRLQGIPDEDIPRYLESILAGEYGQSIYKSSVEKTARAIERSAYVHFYRLVEEKGVSRADAISFTRKSNNGELLMRESYEPGSTGNDTARIIAEAMEETNELLRRSANKYGADIARLPGYLVKQSHDTLRVHRATAETWINDILPLLDHDRTFGRPMTDGEKIKFLEGSWKTIIGGKRHDFVKDLSSDPEFKGPGNLAKKLSHHRNLHFKDGKSAWQYMTDYGRPDVGTSFFGGIDLMSRSIGAMQHLGPNPRFMMDEVIRRAENKLRDAKKLGVSGRKKDYINRLYDEVTGAGSILPGFDDKAGFYLARATNWAKNISSSALLGGTSLTSLADLGTSAARLVEIGVPFLEAHASVVAGLFEGRRTAGKREIADAAAIGIDSLTSGVQARWLGNDGIDGQGANLIGGVMRITGMNWLNDTMKTSVTLALSSYIARQVGKSFDALDGSLAREMSAYGITADDFAQLSGAVRQVEDKSFIDVNLVTDDALTLKLREFFGGFADSAVLTPGARANVMIRGGKRGEVMTELRMLFFHLKSFSIAYGQDILSRVYTRGEGVRIGYALNLVLGMTAYGYLSNVLKDYAKGREPREPSMAAWFDAIMTSGGLGFYGDLMIGAVGAQEQGREVGFLEAVGGPVLGTGLRSLKIIGEIIGGDFDAATYKGIRTVKSMLPGANIFYTRLALDYMLWWQMSEYLNPGWAQNFERRVYDETGQEFFDLVSPTQAVN